jgi:hypothetical protein
MVSLTCVVIDSITSEVFRQSQLYHQSMNLFHSQVTRERQRLSAVEARSRERNAELMVQLNELRYLNHNYKNEIGLVPLPSLSAT